MLGSIGDTISNFAGNFVGNFIDSVMDLAPSLLTNALATAANTVLPGSGVLVQAFAGPIVNAGVNAFETAFLDTVVPALGDAGFSDNELVEQLGQTFLAGVQQGWSG